LDQLNDLYKFNKNFENSDINLDDIAPMVIPENPPWLNPKPTFNFEISEFSKCVLYWVVYHKHFHIED
jgi:hypothetical protein